MSRTKLQRPVKVGDVIVVSGHPDSPDFDVLEINGVMLTI